ncbi:MAG: hypothetical protein NTV89_17845, partial [Proteobacteria bacterium]|nr:hypothetical protein [Pseudomonadota bacterium]
MEDDKKDDKNGMKGFKITDTFGFKEVSAPLYLDLNQNKFSTKISTPSELIYPSVNYGMLDFNNLSASPSLNKQIELEKTINSLKEELSGKILELKDLEKNDEKNKEKIKSLEATHEELVKKEELRYLLTRVNEKAKTKLLESDDFKKLFDDNKICDVVVMAIDIRRSTDLMLKAKTPTHYAEFITSLCKKLTDII